MIVGHLSPGELEKSFSEIKRILYCTLQACSTFIKTLSFYTLLANTYFECRYNNFAPKIKRAFERKTIVSDKELKKGQDLLYFQMRLRKP